MRIDRDTGTVRLVGWPKGVDNRRDDHDIPDDTLRDGVNVDVLTSGKLKLRPGIVQVAADAGAHSGFSDGTRAVWATANALKVADANFTPTTVLSSALLSKPLSYVALHGEIYFSNEDINGKINATGEYEPWGIVGPVVAPTCTPVSVGTRRYQVTCTFVTASGEESGAPLGTEVLCGDVPNIVVTGIPQSSDTRVVATRLYVTNIDGGVFTAIKDVPAGVTVWTITGFFASGATLKTQFMEPPPPGQLLTYYNGSIYIAAGSTVWRTQPLRYGLCRPDEDFFMYPSRVSLLRAVEDGLYVAAGKTWFLTPEDDAANRKTTSQIAVLPYGAIEGAVCGVPDSTDALWLSERGLVRGTNQGKVANITEAQVALGSYERGCLGINERGGHKAAIAVLQGGIEAPLVSEDYLDAEAVRVAEVI